MPQTCFAWCEDEDRSAAETGLAAVLAEDLAVSSGDLIEIPDNYFFVAGIQAGSEFPDYPLIDARLASPGIGGPGINNLRLHRSWAGKDNELDTSNIGSRNPEAMYNYFKEPIRVGEGPNGIAGDTLTAYSLETDESGVAHFNSIVLFVTDTKLPNMPHKITHTVKATVGAIGASVTWEKKTLTLDDDIPVGRYLLWGADLVSASAIAARFQIPGIADFRPAIVPRRTQQEPLHPLNKCIHPGGIPFNYKGGTMGLKLEYCAEATDTALSLHLELEYLGK
jgi:hypothetical protein